MKETGNESRGISRSAVRKILGANLALDVILFDQVGKWAVLEYILRPAAHAGESRDFLAWISSFPVDRLPSAKVELTSFFNLVMVWNQGVSFGMFGDGMAGPLAFVGVAIGICAIFMVWLLKSESWAESIACGLVIGGAIGNIIDRIRFGAVADFLDFHISNLHWPAFNIADACIACGIGLILIDALFLSRRRKEEHFP